MTEESLFRIDQSWLFFTRLAYFCDRYLKLELHASCFIPRNFFSKDQIYISSSI